MDPDDDIRRALGDALHDEPPPAIVRDDVVTAGRRRLARRRAALTSGVVVGVVAIVAGASFVAGRGGVDGSAPPAAPQVVTPTDTPIGMPPMACDAGAPASVSARPPGATVPPTGPAKPGELPPASAEPGAAPPASADRSAPPPPDSTSVALPELPQPPGSAAPQPPTVRPPAASQIDSLEAERLTTAVALDPLPLPAPLDSGALTFCPIGTATSSAMVGVGGRWLAIGVRPRHGEAPGPCSAACETTTVGDTTVQVSGSPLRLMVTAWRTDGARGTVVRVVDAGDSRLEPATPLTAEQLVAIATAPALRSEWPG